MIRSSLAHLHIAAISHPGLTGKNNEDRYSVSSYHVGKEDPRPVVFAVVCDGIGGHRAGEVAAEIAVNYISQGVAQSTPRKPLKILEAAIEDARQEIAAHSAGKRMRDTKQAHDHPNVHVIRRHLGSVQLPAVDFRMFLEGKESDEEAVQN